MKNLLFLPLLLICLAAQAAVFPNRYTTNSDGTSLNIVATGIAQAGGTVGFNDASTSPIWLGGDGSFSLATIVAAIGNCSVVVKGGNLLMYPTDANNRGIFWTANGTASLGGVFFDQIAGKLIVTGGGPVSIAAGSGALQLGTFIQDGTYVKLEQDGPASNGNNRPSKPFPWNSSVWNGSSADTYSFIWQVQPDAGNNAISKLALGYASVNVEQTFANPILSIYTNFIGIGPPVTFSNGITGSGLGLTGVALLAAANIFTGASNSFQSIGATNLTPISVTSDNAVVGGLGEFTNKLVAVGSAISLTTATAANVTSFSLTPGDWDVEGNINFSAASATVTGTQGGIAIVSATLPVDGSEVYSGVQVTLLSEKDSVSLPRKRISLAATTTVYLVAQSTFSAGTVTAFGQMSARRVR
jgi:hypothetical protein